MRRLALVGLAMLCSVFLQAEDESKEPLTGEVRAYYIAADEVNWNYTPRGNLLTEMECCGDATPWLARGLFWHLAFVAMSANT